MASQEIGKMSQNKLKDTDFLLIWNQYFEQPAKDEFDETDNVHSLVSLLHTLFSDHKELYLLQSFPTYLECSIDVKTLFSSLDEGDQQLLDFFLSDPQTWINAISLSISLLHKNKKVITRPYNIDVHTNLKSSDIGKYVSIKGTIITIGTPKLVLLRACFICQDCDFIQKKLPNEDGTISYIKSCTSCKSMNVILDKERSEVELFQKMKINDQNLINIDFEIRDNLVSSFISGDKVIGCGILKTFQDDKKSTIYIKYIKGFHIQLIDEINATENLTLQEFRLFQELKQNGELFYALIQNFCPNIYGHEIIKAGMILSIVGGSNLKLSRSSIHCLLIGDPGQGKSQMLKFANQVAPKSMYISGTAVSQCGLTCTINRKEDDTFIDAGALVLSDEGVCCLDEIDKMTAQHSALLESMEQQTITLAKSSVMCQFHARATILATANPIGGHFQKTKNLLNNIKLQPTLLSRFDLIYLLIDQSDPERDLKLSEHLMRLHNNKKSRLNFEEEKLQITNYSSLKDRLKSRCQLEYQMNVSFIKKVFKHLKQIQPKMTQGAAKIIEEYYLKIRQQNVLSTFPITIRQLESLIRLAESRAKIFGRQQVLEEDAQFVTELFEETRFDCFLGFSDQPNNKGKEINKNNVSTLSKPKQISIFLENLHQYCVEQDSFLFSFENLKQIARKINLQVGDLNDLIEKLNLECFLIKRGSQAYELNYKR